MKNILFLILITLGVALQAQDNFTPKPLDPSVNTEYSELNPLISPDGKVLYFSRLNHPENTMGDHNTSDIWYSTLNPDTTWSVARRMPAPFNTARYNNLFSISSKSDK